MMPGSLCRGNGISYGRAFGKKGGLEQKVCLDPSSQIMDNLRCIDEILESKPFLYYILPDEIVGRLQANGELSPYYGQTLLHADGRNVLRTRLYDQFLYAPALEILQDLFSCLFWHLKRIQKTPACVDLNYLVLCRKPPHGSIELNNQIIGCG